MLDSGNLTSSYDSSGLHENPTLAVHSDLQVLRSASSGPALRTGPLELPSKVLTASPQRWTPRYVACLIALDTLALMLGGLAAGLLRFDSVGGTVLGIEYSYVLLATAPAWILAMATARSYERRYLGLGSEEFRRVANAAARFTALLAVLVFIFRWSITRGLVVLTIPVAAVLTLLFRYLARKVLHRLRRTGAASHRVLVVGDGSSRDWLVHRLQSAPYCGLRVIGVCRPTSRSADGGVSVEHIHRMVTALQADTVAVAHSPSVDPEVLRRIAWSLEGSRVDLLVAPALTDVAGPRVNIRPVSGLPLLQVNEPHLSGVRRLAKGLFDAVVAGTALVALAPVLAAVALAVRLSGPGPVLFRQVRIGRDGREFLMYKFRTMHPDAEQRLSELLDDNDHGDSVLFKMRDDPRVTRVGRLLRRYSLDELPQLFNILRGQMSLVGPRPPLPREVSRYARDVHRRLLVKPGLTGLWQVSGRSDLDWEESVRLDLYYVENWSVALDAEILWKTVWAVVRGSGAH